jgi:N-acyl-D-aspartate/D-glutamate deacylase
MTDYSLLIRNALIVDGSGAPAVHGSVAIEGDRIAAVGAVQGRGAIEIDAGGKVVAPGFIDIHTHYDPQLCWDRLATPSPEHGVTSLVMGNCSISLAPVKPQDRSRLIHLFGSVEDMEGRLLETTCPFEWENFAEYVAYLQRGLGPNVGVFVGHSNLRLYVMGAASQQRVATDAEIQSMCEVLRESLRAGAFGLSYTFNHFDEQGHHLPCHYADRREKLALMQVMAEEGRGMVEVSPNFLEPGAAIAAYDEFGELALATGVTCTLSPILQSPNLQNRWQDMLARLEHWQAKGAPIFAQTQTRPLDMTVQLSEGSAALSKLSSWRQIMDLPVVERTAAFADRARRPQLEAEMLQMEGVLNLFGACAVKRVHAAANEIYLGQRVRDIAAASGRSIPATVLDIAVADGLATEFSLDGYIHGDVDIVTGLLSHPGIHIGSADAGAHITQFSGAGDTCYLIEKFVREEKRMSLEQAVKRLTSDLASGWKIADRGLLQQGKFADVVIFDPDTIERGKEAWVEDVPGGSGRYVRHPRGIDKVIVNGQILVDRGTYTGAQPGRII